LGGESRETKKEEWGRGSPVKSFPQLRDGGKGGGTIRQVRTVGKEIWCGTLYKRGWFRRQAVAGSIKKAEKKTPPAGAPRDGKCGRNEEREWPTLAVGRRIKAVHE